MSLVLTLHIVFLLVWSATLMYFPQLLLRVAAGDDRDAQARAIHMQRSLYAYVMTPSALLAVVAGIWLIFELGFSGGWLPVKLSLVLLMVFFHIWCGVMMDAFKQEPVRHRRMLNRLLPLLPALLIVGVVTLAVGKPF